MRSFAIATAIERASYDPNGQHTQPPRYVYRNGCHALLWELLRDVFVCRSLSSAWAKEQAEIDRTWVCSNDTGPFSFLYVCQHLGVDPAPIRRAYLQGTVIVTGSGVRRLTDERAVQKAVEEALLALCNEVLPSSSSD